MAKININFNNTDYSIDESALSTATSALRQHLSTVMNGSGATINFGGTSYGIDSAKLSTAKNEFVTHLGTIAGSGKKVVIGGVEYGIGSDKVAGAVGELEIVLGNLNSGGGSESYTAGLYQTGAIALYEEQGASAIEGMLIKSWDELLADGTVHVENGLFYTSYNYDDWVNDSSDALTGDLILPDDGSIAVLGDFNDLEWTGKVAFLECYNLTGVKIPNSVTTITDDAFNNCCALTTVVFDENSKLKSIGAAAFYCCENLTSVNIPYGITEIKYQTFCNCSALDNITIPATVASIGDDAFARCYSLTSITIPDSVTTVGNYAFKNCSNLTNVVYIGTIAQWNTITFTAGWNFSTGNYTIHCTNGDITK